MRELTVVVPTKNESTNVVQLIDRLDAALSGMDAEVLFVDDSTDATPDVIASLVPRRNGGLPVRLIHRNGGPVSHPGLAGAVVDGIIAAGGNWVCVMDGDLQHPPEAIPRLVQRASECSAQLVVASRYCLEGHTGGLNIPRKAISVACTMAARLMFGRELAGVSDPMSGFFLVKRDAVRLAALKPRGFKILLEILVKSAPVLVAEIGYRFTDRHSGTSKGTLAEGLNYFGQLFALRRQLVR